MSSTMGANLGDRITGVFWAAFLLFSWTAASIVSGSVIERINSGAFWILAVVIGSVAWVIDAAWGWHASGWIVKLWGYHDAYASGVIHAIAGGFALDLWCWGPGLVNFLRTEHPGISFPIIPGSSVWGFSSFIQVSGVFMWRVMCLRLAQRELGD